MNKILIRWQIYMSVSTDLSSFNTLIQDELGSVINQIWIGITNQEN